MHLKQNMQPFSALCTLDETQVSALIIKHLLDTQRQYIQDDEQFSVQFSLNPHSGEISATILRKHIPTV